MIEVSNVTKYFYIDQKKKIILKNITFKLPSNGLYFVIGKSGSGKSTLLNVLSSILDKDEGIIKIDNQRSDNLSEEEKVDFYNRKIGILFQNFNLFNDLTVKENLDIVLKIKDEVIDEEELNKLLIKYRLFDKMNQKVFYLSSGEKQRLALIRTLINKPKIIFCDEPTGALDKENQLLILKELKNLKKDHLIIVITHNKNLIDDDSSGVLELKNNTIEFKELDNKENHIIKKKERIKRRKVRVITPILKRNLFKNIKKNLIVLFSFTFSILLSLFSITLNFSFNDIRNNLIYSYPNYNVFEVSKVFNQNINESSLSLVRKERVEQDDLYNILHQKGLNGFVISNSYSYFLNQNRTIKLFDQEIEATFHPLFSFSDAKVVVNRTFYDAYLKDIDLDEESSLTLNLSYSSTYTYYSYKVGSEIEEDLSFNVAFQIVDIIDEFNYLSTPKIYYPVPYLDRLFTDLTCLTISNLHQERMSYYSLIKNAKNNDQITSFSSLIYLNENDYLNLNQGIKEELKNEYNIDFSNEPTLIVSSFSSILDTIFIGFNFFIGLTCVTSLLTLVSITFFNYLESRKERAILKILGSDERSINLFYLLENIVLFIASYLIGFLIFNFSKTYIQEIIFKFLNINIDLNSYILIPIIIFIVYSLLIILTTIIPFKASKKVELAKELKEE